MTVTDTTAKKWYESKTLWVNLVALVASITAALGVDLGLTHEAQATAVGVIMSIINLVLRFTTDRPVTL
jgi:hypothetical protein